MNDATHEEYARNVARLILSGSYCPRVAPWLTDSAALAEFWLSASLPDNVRDVACAFPFSSYEYTVAKNNLSSLQHFQAGDRGYCLAHDPSMGTGATLLDDLTEIARAYVAYRPQTNDGGIPSTGSDGPTPMQLCAHEQPVTALGDFQFPSAAEIAEFFATGARHWLSVGDAHGWRRCAGYALHLVQDACVPHHAWGSLFFGYTDWENGLEKVWQAHIERIRIADDDGTLFEDSVGRAVECELGEIRDEGPSTVAELCRENAAVARWRWGKPHELAECSLDDGLLVSIRALASSVRAVQMMGTL